MSATLVYDVSFKEDRGGRFAKLSSHLWKSVGTLSADGKTMTLEYEGRGMVENGKTASYCDLSTSLIPTTAPWLSRERCQG